VREQLGFVLKWRFIVIVLSWNSSPGAKLTFTLYVACVALLVPRVIPDGSDTFQVYDVTPPIGSFTGAGITIVKLFGLPALSRLQISAGGGVVGFGTVAASRIDRVMRIGGLSHEPTTF
jgi:hypothetical protein